jgi:hypothetical protein
MAYPTRTLPSHIRSQSSSLGGSQPSGQSPVLLARIAEKKAELASLKDLQALSAGLADQMQTLAEKLSTLSDGTEGSSLPHPHPAAGQAVTGAAYQRLDAKCSTDVSALQPSPLCYRIGIMCLERSTWRPVSIARR